MRFKRNKANYEVIHLNYLEDYSDTVEEWDKSFPQPFGLVMKATFIVDSDHAHDQKTRRSLTGIFGFVGSTLVLWKSKRQGVVASSAYSAEFTALHSATDVAITLRYMLRCLGCNLPADGNHPSKLFGDDLGAILSSQIPKLICPRNMLLYPFTWYEML